MNISPEFVRVYKKNERLNLRSLAKPSGQEYLFWSKDGGIKVCVKLLNNLNEIVARCYHKTNKLGSYFGIGKHPNEKRSKCRIDKNY